MPTLPLSRSMSIDPIAVLDWLGSQKQSPRLYWASRNGNFEFGGYGAALAVAARDASESGTKWLELESHLHGREEGQGPWFIGGCSFDPLSTDDPLWAGFPPLWFGIPRVSIVRQLDRYTLTVSEPERDGTHRADLLKALQADLDGVSLKTSPFEEVPFPEILSRFDLPDLPGWIDNVKRSLDEIDRRNVEKIVLARRTDLLFSSPTDPFTFLSHLMRKNRNCFAFLLEPRRGKAFLGVTPERLFRTTGREITSEAISGTTANDGIDPEGPPADGFSLYSEKNLLEHRYVLEDITKRVRSLCTTIHAPAHRSAYELSNVSHIYCRISGQLKEGISLSEIISALHPTPAVGGTPREKALPLVRELDPFARGWYAAPVGIVGPHQADMAVAIRSAIVEGARVSLFAGAGIVSGSSPDTEWQELEQKIAHAIEGLSGVLL